MKSVAFLLPCRALGCSSLIAGLLLAATPLHADPLSGGSFVLIGAPSGGGVSSGGPYAVRGWVPSAGAGTSRAQVYEITCGLWGVYWSTDGEVSLNVELTFDGRLRLWWPAEVEGYELEFSPSVGSGASWTPVLPTPVENNHVTELEGGARFFRLRQPGF